MLKVYLLICLFPSYILQFCKFGDLPNSIRNLRIKVINFEINTQVIFSNSNLCGIGDQIETLICG